MSDLLKTPIDEIINNRAKLLGLATNLFGRTSPAVIRAFGQFGRNPELAKIIEAKRNGVFDYGACIRDTSSGVVWPSDTVGVLTAIEKAERGELTVEDLVPIFRGDGTLAEEMFPKVYLKAAAAPVKAKKPKVEPKVEVEAEPEPTPEVENVVPFRAQAPEPEPEPIKAEEKNVNVTVDTTEALIRAGFEGLNLYLGAVHGQISDDIVGIQAAIQTLANNQKILNENLRHIASCLGDLPLGDISDVTFAGTPQVVRLQPPVAQAVSVPAQPVAVRVAPQAPIEPPEDDEVDVDEALLLRLDLSGLRELGVRLGIKNADQLSYAKVLRKKIRAAVGLPPVVD